MTMDIIWNKMKMFLDRNSTDSTWILDEVSWRKSEIQPDHWRHDQLRHNEDERQ